MPGTVVHMAFAGLLAAALLGAAYDRRAVLLVLGVTAIPDLDSFVALVTTAGHRVALHNLVVPTIAGVVLWAETRRENSVVRGRWGARGVRVAFVAVGAYVVAGIGPDAVSGSVNLLYPLHDQFYTIDGELLLSDQRGIVQTFVETEGSLPAPPGQGTSGQVQLDTGIDPDPSGTETDPERVFPVVRAGWQLLLLVVGTAVTLARLRLDHSPN